MLNQKNIIVLFWAATIIIASPLQSSNSSCVSRGIAYEDLLEDYYLRDPETTTAEFFLEDSSSQAVNSLRPELSTHFPTLRSWLSAIRTLPKNREGADSRRNSAFALCGNQEAQWREFEKSLTSWLAMKANSSLADQSNWMLTEVGNTIPNSSFFDINAPINKFQPFAQKLTAPENSIFYMRGDLHGDIFSLAAQLQRLLDEGIIDDSFKIINPHHWMLFLGDYVDRGAYGCEVIYTILRLSLANPDNVIAVRGNHEDALMNERDGFKNEVLNKFNDRDHSKFLKINRIYDFLPAVLYVGCQQDEVMTNYAQCCHGGVEIGYNARSLLNEKHKRYQLIDQLETLTALQTLSSFINNNIQESKKDYSADLEKIYIESTAADLEPQRPEDLGFLWNDFDPTNTTQIAFNTQRDLGFVYGKEGTIDALNLQDSETSKILWIFRGHQHSCENNLMMRGIIASNGVYKLWRPYETAAQRSIKDGLVWTFNVGADSIYGEYIGFNFDTYASVQIAKKPEDWTMRVFNQEIITPQQLFFSQPSSPTASANFFYDQPLVVDSFYQRPEAPAAPQPLKRLKKKSSKKDDLLDMDGYSGEQD